MIRLVSEIETAEEHVNTAETGTVVRLVLSYADRGMWDFKVAVNGKRYSVKQLVRKWNLGKYVRQEEEIA